MMDSNDKEPLDEVKRLGEEIDALRQRLEQSAKKGKQLSWDTELLLKKTENLKLTHKVSCGDPDWRNKVENLNIGPEGVWITDVRTMEDIEFIAAFAGERRLLMTYGKQSFHLEPEPPLTKE